MWISESDLQSSQNKLNKWCSGSWAHELAFSLDLNELWKLFCWLKLLCGSECKFSKFRPSFYFIDRWLGYSYVSWPIKLFFINCFKYQEGPALAWGLYIDHFCSKPVVFKLKVCTHTPMHTTSISFLKKKCRISKCKGEGARAEALPAQFCSPYPQETLKSPLKNNRS